MRALSMFMLVGGLAASGPTAAHWQWQDASGKKVFSDQPPPPSVPERDILRRPSARAAPPSAKLDAAAVPQPAGMDKELQERRRQAEAAETAKRKALQDEQTRARADNCTRARQAKANYDSGVRIARTNAKGEREIIDDATRAAETRRLQDIIGSACS